MIVLNRAFPLFFWQFSEFFGTFFAARSFSVLLKIVHATVKRMTFTWNNRKFHFFLSLLRNEIASKWKAPKNIIYFRKAVERENIRIVFDYARFVAKKS